MAGRCGPERERKPKSTCGLTGACKPGKTGKPKGVWMSAASTRKCSSPAPVTWSRFESLRTT
eukprot:6031503-Pleurochrysis_carterae.AAC.2